MKTSAGILLYRQAVDDIQVFLVHPGGPFWKNKEIGAWSIPKGEFEEGEDSLSAAMREFFEETGQPVAGNFIELSPVKTKSGKQIHAWAVEGDIDANNIVSNTIPIEWPPHSGKSIEIPEVDKGAWFFIDAAKEMINTSQVALIDELINKVIR